MLATDFTSGLNETEYRALFAPGQIQELQNLSEQENKTEEAIRRIVDKGENQGNYKESAGKLGYIIQKDEDGPVVEIKPWRQMKNLLAKEGDDSPSFEEFDNVINANEES
jgi:hypothetical protein